MSYVLKENDAENRPKPDSDSKGQLDRAAIEKSLAEKDKVIARTQWLLYGFLVLLLAAVIVLLALLWPSLNIGANTDTSDTQQTDAVSEVSDAEVTAIDDNTDDIQTQTDASRAIILEQSNTAQASSNTDADANVDNKYLDPSEQAAVAAALAQDKAHDPVQNRQPSRPVAPSTPKPATSKPTPPAPKPQTTTKAPPASRPAPTNNVPKKEAAPAPPPSVDVSREIDTSYEAFVNAAQNPVLVAPEE